MSQSQAILNLNHIYKSFGGVKALQDVDFDLREGEIHGIAGENGAGKSTLMKILAGIEIPDSGNIVLYDEEKKFAKPSDAIDNGISIVHQEMNLVSELSVISNVFLGRETDKFSIVLTNRFLRQKYNKLVSKYGFDLNGSQLVKNLSIAEQQIVQILKALSLENKVIIMDEPTSSIGRKEVDILFNILLRLRKEGHSIIFISHILEDVLEISDRITVLRDGKKITSDNTENFTMESLITNMIGRNIEEEFPKLDNKPGETVLEVKNLSKKGKLNNISFSLRKGEIIGFLGLVGSGFSTIANILFGIEDFDSGEIRINDTDVKIKSTKHAIRNGIALVPENRKTQGLVMELSVIENISLVNTEKFMKGPVISKKLGRAIFKETNDVLNIKCSSLNQLVEDLSGGNQQKVVFGKFLNSDFQILILNDPARGIDVGAKMQIFRLMKDLANEGKSIILISSELNEIVNMSNRIFVISKGEIRATLAGEEAKGKDLISLMSE